VPTIPPGIDRYLYFLYNYRFRHAPRQGARRLWCGLFLGIADMF
jgi:hypothetical protein